MRSITKRDERAAERVFFFARVFGLGSSALDSAARSSGWRVGRVSFRGSERREDSLRDEGFSAEASGWRFSSAAGASVCCSVRSSRWAGF